MSRIVHLWCEMAPIDLNPVRSFVAVHETGSFSAAAQRLRVPRSTVSRAVAALEDAVGAVLFHRTTRTVTVTAEGKQLYDRVVVPLAGLEGAISDRREPGEEPSGTLRVTTTVDIGTMVLAEAVNRFSARYPAVAVQVRLTNSIVDLAREGFDLALRVAIGPRPSSSLVSRRVGTMVSQLYASPAYLARRGTPRSPEELRGLDWVAFPGAPPLHLTSGAAKIALHARTARITGDDVFFAREILRGGGGVGALPSYVAEDDVARGTLARVLPSWVAHLGALYLVLPGRAHLPARVTVFRDLLAEMLRQRPIGRTPG
jgi:DNA-binding transcriptional LysR family regulator